MCKVSIIIPKYNHTKYLPQRLESVYDQTYQDFEVILLDDCINDDNVAILNTYAKHPKRAMLFLMYLITDRKLNAFALKKPLFKQCSNLESSIGVRASWD